MGLPYYIYRRVADRAKPDQPVAVAERTDQPVAVAERTDQPVAVAERIGRLQVQVLLQRGER